MLTVGSGGLWRNAALLTVLVLALAAILSLSFGSLDEAYLGAPLHGLLAGATYVSVVVLVAAFGVVAAFPLMLRMPAAAAIGQVGIAAASGGWVAKSGAIHVEALRTAAIVLGVGALGYLIIEARGHGRDAWSAVGLALSIWVVGAIHSLLVAMVITSWVVPLTTSDVEVTMLARGDLFAIVGFLAGAGLAAGVLLQLLWETRPVTYPLAHLEVPR